MPAPVHRLAMRPRLMLDVTFNHPAIDGDDDPAERTIAVPGARKNMVILVRMKPSIQNEHSMVPVGAYCKEADKVIIQFFGDAIAGVMTVTVVGI